LSIVIIDFIDLLLDGWLSMASAGSTAGESWCGGGFLVEYNVEWSPQWKPSRS
jgi:hypothetical protein